MQRQTQLWKTFDFGHSAGYLKPLVFTFTFTVLILKCGSNYADMESAKVNKVTTYAVQNYIFTAEYNKSNWKATRKLIKNCLEQVWVWTQLAGRLGFLEWGCSTFIPYLKKKKFLNNCWFLHSVHSICSGDVCWKKETNSSLNLVSKTLLIYPCTTFQMVKAYKRCVGNVKEFWLYDLGLKMLRSQPQALDFLLTVEQN